MQVVDPADLKPGSGKVTILTANGGAADVGLKAALNASPVLRYAASPLTGKTVAVSYTVDFSGRSLLQDQGLGSTDRFTVGDEINALQQSGGAAGIAALVSVTHAAGFGAGSGGSL